MKIKTLTLFLLLGTLYSKAQIVESIGIKGGCSVSNQTWEYKSTNYTDKKDNKIGAYSALTATLFRAKYINMSTDLGFVQKGSKETMEETTFDYPEGTGNYITYKTTINYLTFSPMLKAHYSIKKITPYIFCGPRVDLQVGAKLPYSQFMYAYLNKVLWGLTYGGGVEFKKNKFGVLLEFQNYPDFIPIVDTFWLKIKGNACAVTAGVKYYFLKQEKGS